MSNDLYDVVIVGGGFSGLSALSYLSKYRTLILESSRKLGGRVYTECIGDYSVELGALYPLQNNNEELDSKVEEGYGVKPILFILSQTETYEYNTPIEAFNSLGEKEGSNNSQLFFKQHLFKNEAINLTIKNPSYGDLNLVTSQQRLLLESLHQITHPGDIQQFPSQLRPLCLANLPRIKPKISNEKTLMNWYPIPENGKVSLNSKVVNISETDDHVNIRYNVNDKANEVKSRSVILTPPPPLCFNTINFINEDSIRFYQSTPYLSGWSIVLNYTGPIPEYSLFVSRIHLWSVGFITILNENNFIVNCYVPFSRLIESVTGLSIDLIERTVSSHLSSKCKFIGSHSKYWRYLAPNIAQSTFDTYSSNHYRLTERVIYGGELSTFTPKTPYSYGLANALKAGQITAQRVIKEVLDCETSSCRTTLPPLLKAHIYTLYNDRPKYVGSKQEGNIAFYGLLLSSSGSKKISSYLSSHSIDGLWEYHTGFGVTLEDSLLVLEGLIDDGLASERIKYHLSLCIKYFFDSKLGLFNTLNGGRANYWEGPSIHGTAHAAYLIFKHCDYPEKLISLNKLIEYIKNEFTDDFVWKSRWFTNYHFTSFYVIRLLNHLPCDNKIRKLVNCFYENVSQTQLSDGSWNSSPISTASVLMSLTSMRLAEIQNHKYEFNKIIKNGSEYLLNCFAKQSFPTESILYYWYDISKSSKQDTKQFFQCMDTGKISKALSILALKSTDYYTINLGLNLD